MDARTPLERAMDEAVFGIVQQHKGIYLPELLNHCREAGSPDDVKAALNRLAAAGEVLVKPAIEGNTARLLVLRDRFAPI
jgi:hypothetical protein